jgi:ABC-type sugar transport system permease subunit
LKTPKIRLTMRQRRSVTGLLFVMPFVIGLLLFILRPMITSIQMSFSKVNLNGAAGGFSMEFVGWANFLQALTIDKDFNRLLTESVRDTLIDGVCIIIFSLIIAVILNRKFPGRGAVRAIFFMPVILASGVVLGMEKSNMLLQGIQDLQSASTNTTITTTVQELLLGALGNTASDLIQLIMNIINHFYDIVVASSIQTVIFLSALQTINPSIYEAAEMEGCGAWEKLWKITIPLLSPMILVNWIYTIIDRFIRADNQLMTKILDCITETLDYGFSSAMAWIYCLCMVALIGISALIISRMVYYYE